MPLAPFLLPGPPDAVAAIARADEKPDIFPVMPVKYGFGKQDPSSRFAARRAPAGRARLFVDGQG